MLRHLGMHEHHLLPHSIYLHKGMPIAHDLDNLYVVDTSFFPSIGAVNPSLTAIANALRVGDHVAARRADGISHAARYRLSPGVLADIVSASVSSSSSPRVSSR